MNEELRKFLEEKVDEHNRPGFIPSDPVCIPHLFTKKEDIEIAGFFAATFAWGNRTTIINKSKELMRLMGDEPHQFIRYHSPTELQRLLHFRHRTFNTDDLLYFIQFLQHHYQKHASLEEAFLPRPAGQVHIEEALNYFYHYFFSMEPVSERTRKHIAAPFKGSTCKRLNMFLRWMVRRDDRGVDFGIWQRISPADLICPVDVHVARVARRFGLIGRTATDWLAAVELTEILKTWDAADPVKFDFALFSLGVGKEM